MALPLQILENLELLRDLPPERRAALAGSMTERVFARREIVFNKEEPGKFLCFLLDGRLQGVDFTLDGREVGLYFVSAGCYFGEMSVLDGGPRPDYVIAVARSRVAFLPSEEARQVMTQIPGVAGQVLQRLAGRLRAVAAQRTLLSLPNPAQRVCAQLVQLATTTDHDRVRVIHAPTHQEIAIMINASRETVTRVFQVLQARHVVARDGSDLLIEDAAYLRDVAAGIRELPRNG